MEGALVILSGREEWFTKGKDVGKVCDVWRLIFKTGLSCEYLLWEGCGCFLEQHNLLSYVIAE